MSEQNSSGRMYTTTRMSSVKRKETGDYNRMPENLREMMVEPFNKKLKLVMHKDSATGKWSASDHTTNSGNRLTEGTQINQVQREFVTSKGEIREASEWNNPKSAVVGKYLPRRNCRRDSSENKAMSGTDIVNAGNRSLRSSRKTCAYQTVDQNIVKEKFHHTSYNIGQKAYIAAPTVGAENISHLNPQVTNHISIPKCETAIKSSTNSEINKENEFCTNSVLSFVHNNFTDNQNCLHKEQKSQQVELSDKDVYIVELCDASDSNCEGNQSPCTKTVDLSRNIDIRLMPFKTENTSEHRLNDGNNHNQSSCVSTVSGVGAEYEAPNVVPDKHLMADNKLDDNTSLVKETNGIKSIAEETSCTKTMEDIGNIGGIDITSSKWETNISKLPVMDVRNVNIQQNETYMNSCTGQAIAKNSSSVNEAASMDMNNKGVFYTNEYNAMGSLLAQSQFQCTNYNQDKYGNQLTVRATAAYDGTESNYIETNFDDLLQMHSDKNAVENFRDIDELINWTVANTVEPEDVASTNIVTENLQKANERLPVDPFQAKPAGDSADETKCLIEVYMMETNDTDINNNSDTSLLHGSVSKAGITEFVDQNHTGDPNFSRNMFYAQRESFPERFVSATETQYHTGSLHKTHPKDSFNLDSFDGLDWCEGFKSDEAHRKGRMSPIGNAESLDAFPTGQVMLPMTTHLSNEPNTENQRAMKSVGNPLASSTKEEKKRNRMSKKKSRPHSKKSRIQKVTDAETVNKIGNHIKRTKDTGPVRSKLGTDAEKMTTRSSVKSKKCENKTEDNFTVSLQKDAVKHWTISKITNTNEEDNETSKGISDTKGTNKTDKVSKTKSEKKKAGGGKSCKSGKDNKNNNKTGNYKKTVSKKIVRRKDLCTRLADNIVERKKILLKVKKGYFGKTPHIVRVQEDGLVLDVSEEYKEFLP